MKVGGFSFVVIEKTIAEAATLPADGENIFHSHVLVGINVHFFFKEEFRDKNWRSGVQKEWF